MKNQLLGALIGIARAADGSEHLISPSSTGAILDGLAALETGGDLEAMLHRAREEKRKMVPDCFTCACPCGRTDDYDMARLDLAAGEVRSLKAELLEGIRRMAAKNLRSDAIDRFFYKALFAIGMDDFGPAELDPILEEMRQLTRN